MQKMPELRTGKERNQGTRENGQIGQYTHTAESANVRSTEHSTWEITLRVAQIVNTEELQHYVA
jgi:hypothetical protein